MNVIQMGVPKSGNFWLYQIVQQILKRTGNYRSSFIEKQPIHQIAKQWTLNYPTQANIDMIDITDSKTIYRVSNIFKMPIEDLTDYVSQTNHVWTHSPICQKSGEIFSQFEKKVYIIRDPRDVAISASRYYCSDYFRRYYFQEEKDPQKYLEKYFDKLLQEWVWHVWDHLRLSAENNIHISFYEGFLLDFQSELDILLKYLEVELNKSEKKELEEAVSFSTLKKENPKHLKKGKSGYWMEQLSEAHKKRAEMIAGPLIEFLGYPEKGEKMKFSRNFPHRDFLKLKTKLMDSQRGLFK